MPSGVCFAYDLSEKHAVLAGVLSSQRWQCDGSIHIAGPRLQWQVRALPLMRTGKCRALQSRRRGWTRWLAAMWESPQPQGLPARQLGLKRACSGDSQVRNEGARAVPATCESMGSLPQYGLHGCNEH